MRLIRPPESRPPEAGIDDDIEAFCAYLRAECGLAENTVLAYRRDLQRFRRWLASEGTTAYAQMNVRDLARYLDYLSREKLAPASVARHVVSLRMFFRFLVLEGRTDKSAAEHIERPSLWSRVPHVLSEEQVDRLLAAPNCEDTWFRRDRAILETLYATGCRVSEVSGLRLTDLALRDGFLRCVGKGNKERIVPIGRAARKALEDYLSEERPTLVARYPESPWLFVNRFGKRLSRVSLWSIVKKYARRAGLPPAVSPHTLRHSFATHMLARGADIRLVQELLGHAKITTTQIYTHVDPHRLKAVHEQHHPRP